MLMASFAMERSACPNCSRVRLGLHESITFYGKLRPGVKLWIMTGKESSQIFR